MFRWGVLSTAKIGVTQVIPALCASDNGVVHAIASRDHAKARAVADRFGVPLSFGSYEELLACDEVDGVYIPLPTAQHVEWALKAAQAGKHVLCEKPIALKAEDIDPLIAARDRYKVVMAEAFMVYYHPQWIKLRYLLAEGAIGTLRHVQGAFTYFNVDAGNMRNRPELGGGALPDIGVYPTVVTRMVTGKEPLSVQARVEYDPKFGTDRYANVAARFDGFDLSFYVATQLAGRQTMVFHGDKGFIEVHAPFNTGKYGHGRITLYDAAHTQASEWSFGDANHYQLQAENFVRAVRGENVMLFSLENSRANQKFIDAIYRAGKNEGFVDV
ncbi:oxidoreductase [Falsochrobactrum shanghaiense]|uniref:Oxidoreductase n=1 Tax=Falsochrobactrum shanghaiense TaxID=2201899 RepID=A0A316JE27_9HYPH|nr:Gfo/Idh/MocA family oxidoreductase [Falsochrobactrum shanghaiense]PWL19511.1 oxidoreductase [Falsochrobactrum shanghaiense]